MLEDTVGDVIFQTGITSYLNKYAYSNAVTQDLWNEIQSAIVGDLSLNVTEFMDTFTVQMGYPILDVTISADNKYTLTQKRFLIDYTTADNSPVSPLK